ncbi:MAG: DUF2335 domain-containing protein [Candidatus Paceibacterota bacterium]
MSKKKKNQKTVRSLPHSFNNSPNERGVVVHKQHVRHSFSGPLPHPDVLHRFEEVSPGAAERIIKMAEEQSSHRRNLEKKVIESDIYRSKWGQILGFIIAIVGLSVSAVIGVFGNPVAGSIMGTGTVAGLVWVFMYGSRLKSEELKEKKEDL